MQGYDAKAAKDYIVKRLSAQAKNNFPGERAQALVGEAIKADLAFMESSGVLRDGQAGDSYYDDDEAFDVLCEELCRHLGADEEQALAVAQLVDEYMDLQQAYLEQAGLVEWD